MWGRGGSGGRGGGLGIQVGNSSRDSPSPLWTCDMAHISLLLGRQDGEGAVELYHADNEEATGQQEGGPEEGKKEGLGPVEALV